MELYLIKYQHVTYVTIENLDLIPMAQQLKPLASAVRDTARYVRQCKSAFTYYK